MAKLVDLLAKYLVEWPDDCSRITQRQNGDVIGSEGFGYQRCICTLDAAEDRETSVVTQSKYLAARDRMHVETLKGMYVSGVLEAQEFDTDQALWDKVAKDLYCQWVSIASSKESWRIDAEHACNAADAFMAERAKRLKGGA